jgi:thymidylate synthase
LFIREDTLDDILQVLFEHFLKKERVYISTSKGKIASEEFGVLIELTNPRARLSRSEIKGTIFSCLGELCWYLSGSKSLEHMMYYIPRYSDSSDDGETVHGAYGPRLLNMHGKYNQLENVIKLIQRKATSRRAVIQLLDASDIDESRDFKDIPCTTTIQLLVRNKKLEMMVHMRSNDIYLGLSHDIFCFTMIQEIIANRLNIEVGSYKHSVGSLHLYERDIQRVKDCVGEGWHSTKYMAAMPKESTTNMVNAFLSYEETIRLYGHYDQNIEDNMPPYWKDLMLMSRAFSIFKRDESIKELDVIKTQLIDKNYEIYIEKLVHKLKQKNSRKESSVE